VDSTTSQTEGLIWLDGSRGAVPKQRARAQRTLLAPTSRARAVGVRLRGSARHAPAHIDAEVLSALGRLERACRLDDVETADGLLALSELPIERHAVSPLLLGAWTLRNELRSVTEAIS
jgi:predicted nucleic acid-binding protein